MRKATTKRHLFCARRRFGFSIVPDTSDRLSRRFAKTIAGLAAIALIFMLIRCLPKRIRGFVSAFATTVIAFALFKISLQNFGLFVAKTTIIHFAIVGIVSVTVTLCVIMATAAVLTHKFMQERVKVVPIHIRTHRLVSSRRSIIASNAFLQTSPIIIQ